MRKCSPEICTSRQAGVKKMVEEEEEEEEEEETSLGNSNGIFRGRAEGDQTAAATAAAAGHWSESYSLDHIAAAAAEKAFSFSRRDGIHLFHASESSEESDDNGDDGQEDEKKGNLSTFSIVQACMSDRFLGKHLENAS
jgi:hypothetical protein